MFRDIESGSYFLKINATGFFSEYYPVEIIKPRSICQVNAVLKEDLKSSKGIILGVISDCDEMPLANADVILYRVGTDISLVPVAYTRTNHEGIYLFVNVPQGEYLVNSNRSILWIDASNRIRLLHIKLLYIIKTIKSMVIIALLVMLFSICSF